MLLVIAAALLIATVPLAGGNLKRLADLDIRAPWTVLLSCAIQVGITSAIGAILNILAIVTNDGTMPASSFALRVSGIDVSGGFENSGHVAHANLAVLGDVIPVPGPWPIGNVLSIGDLLIYTGGFIVLHYACQSRLAWGRRRLASA